MTVAEGLKIPVDEEAEAGLVACCVDSHVAFLLAASRVQSDDFYVPRHRRLFDACASLGRLDGPSWDTRNERVVEAARIAGVAEKELRKMLDERTTSDDKAGRLAARIVDARRRRDLMSLTARVYNAVAVGARLDEVEPLLDQLRTFPC